MVQWRKILNLDGRDRRHIHDELRSLLPSNSHDLPRSPIPPLEVTKVALRLKRQLETVIPCELDESKITDPNSSVITEKVVDTAKSAGGSEYRACVVYCLLVVRRWFQRQALLELWDADMHEVRALAADVIAKRIIEDEEDMGYLLQDVLLNRYSILVKGEATLPANAIERAVDLHALNTIGSSGYQKCVNYLWRGWLVQDENDPSRFIEYKLKTNPSYWVHLDPDRMRVPKYQNFVHIGFSIIYLALFTGAINTINPTGDLDVVEGLLYIFSFGFICDEAAKFWKVGRYYIGFWNVFNLTLYAFLAVSFVTRMIALSHELHSEEREHFNELSYNFLAFTAPMFWMRILLFLDTYRFFGAMLVVVKVMMKESIIFFALLLFVIVGFMQAFVGMDQIDNNLTAVGFVTKAMANSIMQSPDFDGFDNYAPPFGLILYYIYTFVVMVVLLNILIALYNSAYEDITDNAIDEYMALFSQKCLQFVRAPDENVFIAPFNLIELFCLIIPFEWWLEKSRYEKLNDYVMAFVYSPVLVIIAFLEAKSARKVIVNRRRGEEDEDTIEEWEQISGEIEGTDEWGKWVEECERTAPDVAASEVGLLKELKKEVERLSKMVEELKREQDGIDLTLAQADGADF